MVDTEYPTADPKTVRACMAAAFLLGAIACDALDASEAVGLAMEHALDLPGMDKIPSLVPIQPAPDGKSARLLAPLTAGETRVLRYLPSHLSAPEIADELYLSSNTVRTHLRHLYRKLDVHTRSQAIARARALGLLSRPPLDRPAPSGLDRGLVAPVRDFPARATGSELLADLLRVAGGVAG